MKHLILVLIFSFLLSACDSDSKTTRSGQIPTEQNTPPVEQNNPPVEQNNPPVEEIDTFAELSWIAPLTRVNGEKLHLYEIDYYIITRYWGENEEEIQVEYSADTDKFTDLSPGLHEFEIKTVDINGLTSVPSNRVSKTIEGENGV